MIGAANGMTWIRMDSARLTGNSADLLFYSAELGLYSANFASYSAETAINSAKLLLVAYFYGLLRPPLRL
jgi:hypothetical protein